MKKRTLISILLTLSVTLGILLVMGLTASAAEYDLWIKGVQVTDDNKDDVLGDGIVRYDSEDRILYLYGDISSGHSGTNGVIGETIIRSEIDGMTIDVMKDSHLGMFNTYGKDPEAVIILEGDTTIKGNGELNLNARGYWLAMGIDNMIYLKNADLVIEHMTLRINQVEDGNNYGIRCLDGNVKIIASELYSHGFSGAISCKNGEISIDGCMITSPGGVNNKNGEIRDSSDHIVSDIIISKTTHKVTSNALNVREGPGTDYSRIGGLLLDKEVVVLETQGEWSKIVYGTGFGWVQSKYLDPLEEATYTVTFDANGGSGSMPTMTVKEGEKLTLPECTFTPPEGKVFDRWIAGKPGEQVDVGGDSIIRALWKDSESFGLTNPFVDIYETDTYYDAVLWAYYADPQITNGMDETHFGPGLTVTRGQAVTFLWRSQGCPEPSSLYNPFVDVPSTEYYYKPILWAVEKGITKGTTEYSFSPDDTLSTQHIVTFIYRTKNPGMDGWNGEAAAWAADENGKPFGIDIAVNNETDCPRCHVVQFLYWLSK